MRRDRQAAGNAQPIDGLRRKARVRARQLFSDAREPAIPPDPAPQVRHELVSAVHSTVWTGREVRFVKKPDGTRMAECTSSSRSPDVPTSSPRGRQTRARWRCCHRRTSRPSAGREIFGSVTIKRVGWKVQNKSIAIFAGDSGLSAIALNRKRPVCFAPGMTARKPAWPAGKLAPRRQL